MRLIDRLDAWGRAFDARWFAWLERDIRPRVDATLDLALAIVPLIGLALFAYFVLSLLI